MQTQHHAHLRSTESTIREHLAAIRKVAMTGESPGGARGRPLPDYPRDELLTVLEGVEAGLSDLVRLLVPEDPGIGGEDRDTGGSWMWVAILLRTVAELVRDLSPELMARRYGALDSASVAVLRERIPRLLHEIDRGAGLLRR